MVDAALLTGSTPAVLGTPPPPLLPALFELRSWLELEFSFRTVWLRPEPYSDVSGDECALDPEPEPHQGKHPKQPAFYKACSWSDPWSNPLRSPGAHAPLSLDPSTEYAAPLPPILTPSLFLRTPVPTPTPVPVSVPVPSPAPAPPPIAMPADDAPPPSVELELSAVASLTPPLSDSEFIIADPARLTPRLAPELLVPVPVPVVPEEEETDRSLRSLRRRRRDVWLPNSSAMRCIDMDHGVSGCTAMRCTSSHRVSRLVYSGATNELTAGARPCNAPNESALPTPVTPC